MPLKNYNPSSKDIQTEFFDRIKARLDQESSLVETISEVLNVSDDSAYRRIRGETLLNIEELKTLSMEYKLSLDELMTSFNNGMFFHYRSVKRSGLDFNFYYSEMAETMEQLQQAPGAKMLFAAMDIPIFHYFNFPEIMMFKTYFWRKTVWEDPNLADVDFNLSYLMKKHGAALERDGNRILNAYINLPSTEIWHDWTIESTLRQIEFAFDSGFFKHRGDCQRLLEEIYQLMEHIEDQTRSGYKFKVGQKPEKKKPNYNVYLNEILFLNNTIVADTDEVRQVFIIHEAVNYLVTDNKMFCDETSDWMEIQKRKAILITNSSEKIMNKFFKQQYKRIEKMMKKIAVFSEE